RRLQDIWHEYGLKIKLKILVSFYLIATVVHKVYEVDIPYELLNFLNSIFGIISLGFNSVDSVLQCLNWHGYMASLAVHMAAPAVIAVAIVIVGAIFMRKRERTTVPLLERTAPYLLQLLFLAYPIVSRVAFDGFSCYTFTSENGTEREKEFLKADVSIECDTPKHREVQKLASVAIAVYPVGLLVLVAVLLFSARHAIYSNTPTRLSRATAFLHREYQPHLFWWELVEMLRRIVLVGLMVLYQDTMMQLIVGSLLSAMFLLLQVQASPYKEANDNLLAASVSFCLVVYFMVCTAFKNTALTNLADIQTKLSNEQRNLYVLSVDSLSALGMISVAGALVCSIAIFAVQLSAEIARHRINLLSADDLSIIYGELWWHVESTSPTKMRKNFREKLPWLSIEMRRTANAAFGHHARQSGSYRNSGSRPSIIRARVTRTHPKVVSDFDEAALGNVNINPPILRMMSGMSSFEESSAKSVNLNTLGKFTAKTLITGQPADAARGLPYYMGVPDPLGLSRDGVQLIQMEVARFVASVRTMSDIDAAELETLKGIAQISPSAFSSELVKQVAEDLEKWLEYILFKGTSEKEFTNGIRDEGRGSVLLSYFLEHEKAVEAKLEPAHVVALRFYTTHAFKYLNGPLRSDKFGHEKNPHPLPKTLTFISEGIKRLRAVHAGQLNDKKMPIVNLWRGMRNLQLAEDFVMDNRGGTEVAPMSTTSDILVATKYGLGQNTLLFKIKATNILQLGADLQWLSAFPSEAEVVYPPLTYLQPTGKIQEVKVRDYTCTVCEVIPHIP
ncbi:MAG: hypothetical protein SGPRY_008246, partial [Prymnesium sp.]